MKTLRYRFSGAVHAKLNPLVLDLADVEVGEARGQDDRRVVQRECAEDERRQTASRVAGWRP